jgi:deferrochelatase/peroxidase EfeB
MSVTPQRALSHDPGRFRALFTFDAVDADKGGRELLIAAATLLKELESAELRNKPLNVLVAVAHGLFADHPDGQRLESEFVPLPRTNPAETQPALLIQVAAETEDERTYAKRLIRRVLGKSALLRDEYYGGRHALGREAFGYRELPPTPPKGDMAGAVEPVVVVPTSAAVPGVAWLLYQRCVQKLDEFYAQTPIQQDSVVGRQRDPRPEQPYDAKANSHAAIQRKLNGDPLRPKLLRRSIGYTHYDEEGLLFLASAGSAQDLVDSLNALDGDRLQKFITLEENGLYVVPPSSEWLCPGQKLIALEQDRPLAEQIFYPRFPLVLYEVTPLTLKFFRRVFHAHKDHFDERGKLREDLKLMTKGLAKMLYGGTIPSDSSLFHFLKDIFVSDSSAAVAGEVEIDEAVTELRSKETIDKRADTTHQGAPPAVETFRERLESISRRRLAHEINRRGRRGQDLDGGDRLFDAEVADERQRLQRDLREPGRIERAKRGAPWLARSARDLFSDMVVNDAETMSGRGQSDKDDLDTLIALCEAAADEARQINKSVGYYMTFMC